MWLVSLGANYDTDTANLVGINSARTVPVDSFEPNEEHAELRTPVSGRMGDRRASKGNLVPDGTSGRTILLSTIELIDPIRFGSILGDASYVRHARFFKDSGDVRKAYDDARVIETYDKFDFVRRYMSTEDYGKFVRKLAADERAAMERLGFARKE